MGGTPLPHPARNNPPIKNDDLATFDFSVVVPCEIQVGILENTTGFADMGGEGGGPHPPSLFFSKKGSPSPPCVGPGGGYPPPHPVVLMGPDPWEW
jgi:hypothetical protein